VEKKRRRGRDGVHGKTIPLARKDTSIGEGARKVQQKKKKPGELKRGRKKPPWKYVEHTADLCNTSFRKAEAGEGRDNRRNRMF